ALAHLVVTQALPSAAIEDFVEVPIGNHYEPHPEPMGVVEALAPRGSFVALGLKKRLHLNHEPRLVAPIMHSDIVVLVLAPHAGSLVAEDFVEELSDQLPFLLLATIAKVSDERNVRWWNLDGVSDDGRRYRRMNDLGESDRE